MHTNRIFLLVIICLLFAVNTSAQQISTAITVYNNNMALVKDSRNVDIEKGAVIIGNVIIGKNSEIKTGSYIEGPVIIGENCTIGPNCYLRPYTCIGNHCHVGNASEIKNSIIMDHTNVPHHNYVGDSVIGRYCNLGSGTKIANLRLDKKIISVNLNGKRISTDRRKLGTIMGDNVQTGINSMIDTGAIIGNNVFIGPGALASGEFQPNTKVF